MTSIWDVRMRLVKDDWYGENFYERHHCLCIEGLLRRREWDGFWQKILVGPGSLPGPA